MPKLMIFLLLVLAGCAVYNDVPVPVIDPNAPTFPLAPDSLPFGELPR